MSGFGGSLSLYDARWSSLLTATGYKLYGGNREKSFVLFCVYFYKFTSPEIVTTATATALHSQFIRVGRKVWQSFNIIDDSVVWSLKLRWQKNLTCQSKSHQISYHFHFRRNRHKTHMKVFSWRLHLPRSHFYVFMCAIKRFHKLSVYVCWSYWRLLGSVSLRSSTDILNGCLIGSSTENRDRVSRTRQIENDIS